MIYSKWLYKVNHAVYGDREKFKSIFIVRGLS